MPDDEVIEVFNSIYESGRVPAGWTPLRGGTRKVSVKNTTIRRMLRNIRAGRWKKVYQKGTGGVEMHYFQHESGLVFGVKPV